MAFWNKSNSIKNSQLLDEKIKELEYEIEKDQQQLASGSIKYINSTTTYPYVSSTPVNGLRSSGHVVSHTTIHDILKPLDVYFMYNRETKKGRLLYSITSWGSPIMGYAGWIDAISGEALSVSELVGDVLLTKLDLYKILEAIVENENTSS